MRNFKLTLAYDGTDYFGWQAQGRSDRPTVQEMLEAAIAKVTGERAPLHASGRTDTGVHALGQVASFRSETELTPHVLQKALNAVLPEDIAVLELSEASDDFHPRYSAKRKHYRYLIYDGPVRDVFTRRYAWHYRKGRLDAEAMRRAAQPLLGTHDFTAFESSGAKRKTSVRTVFALELRRGRAGEGGAKGEGGREKGDFHFPQTASDPENWITFDIAADGFLYNMVRTILGTLVEVGRGAQPETWPLEILHAADRRVAGPTAPPQGLFLVAVEYAP
jgi:tRNA pseudouridine38-40 synthase